MSADVPDPTAPISDGGAGVWARIEIRLNRIEDKLDNRMGTLERKVEDISSRQATLEGELHGVVSVIKWIGPVGLAALIGGILAMTGVVHLPGAQ